MKCTYCGATIETGKVFCPSCGHEIQMVPDYNAFEDELLHGQFKDQTTKINQEEIEKRKNEMALQHQKKLQEQKKKRMILAASIIGVVLVAVIVILSVVLVKTNQQNSFAYQFKKAQEAYNNKDYKTAINHLEKANALDLQNVDSRLLLVDCYRETNDNDAALVVCNEIIRLDSKNIEAYKNMIEIYSSKNDLDSIVKLGNSVSDESVLSLFSDYIVTVPVFSKDGGTYNEFVTLHLTSVDNHDIFYTTDGSDPRKGGFKYSDSIAINELGTFVVKAVCKNKKGLFSEVVEKKYTISIDAPKTPEVNLINLGENDTITEATRIEITVPEGCTAYFSWDGTDVDPDSEDANKYYNPITIPTGNNILTVIIVDDKTKLRSDIFRGNYVLNPKK